MLEAKEETTEIIDAICIYGAKGVGKSSFAMKINQILAPGQMEEENIRVRKIIQYKPMVITGYHELDETSIKDDDYEIFYEPAMQETRAFFLMFSMDDVDSFRISKELYTDICQFKGNQVFPVVLIANKSDLEHKIFSQEIEEFCQENDLVYYETSCISGKNVDESFTYLLENMVKYEKNEKISDYCQIS
eukprot:gene7706-12172_t